MGATSNYTAADRERWKQAILAAGKGVADQIERIKAGQDVNLSELDAFGLSPVGETKEERLRRYLDHLMARLKVVGDPKFGWDAERGEFWTVAELDEQPWADLGP